MLSFQPTINYITNINSRPGTRVVQECSRIVYENSLNFFDLKNTSSILILSFLRLITPYINKAS